MLNSPCCIYGSLALAAIIAQSACSGGGAADRRDGGDGSLSSASAYTGPAPATSDVQAFAVSFWKQRARAESLRTMPQRHLAGTDAELTRADDDVNLAYAQAIPSSICSSPSTSRIVVKVSGGHMLAERSHACGRY